jgi:hypothetical protein
LFGAGSNKKTIAKKGLNIWRTFFKESQGV